MALLFLFVFSSCQLDVDGTNTLRDQCGFFIDPLTGKRHTWKRSSFPIPFYVHHSVSPEAHKNFVSAVAHWNLAWEEFLWNKGVEPFPLFLVVNPKITYSGSPKNDGYNILFFAEDDFLELAPTYSLSSTQAVTSLYSGSLFSKGNIKEADIIVNNSGGVKFFYDEDYNDQVDLAKLNKSKEFRRLASLQSESFWFRFKKQIQNWFQFLLKPFQKEKELNRGIASSAKVPRGFIDFASVMIHELGHVPGLTHIEAIDIDRNRNKNQRASRFHRRGSSRNRESDTVMESRLSDGLARRKIKDYDMENLFCAYFGY